MTEKNKRKGTPPRPIWLVVSVLLVIVAMGIVGWRLYSSLSTSDDGADIIFLRDDGNRTMNIYTLDIDDPEADAVALTDYTLNDSAHIDSFATPDDGSWVVFNELESSTGIIKKIDIATGEISTLMECDTEEILGCWLLDVSPDGHYMVFGGLVKSDPGAEVAWLINLEDETVPPILLEDGGAAPVHFISNEQVAYWAYESDAIVIYDIATGDVSETTITSYNPLFSPNGHFNATSQINSEGDIIEYDYTIFNLRDGTESTFTSPYGDPQEPYTIWHPDNTRFLARAYNFEGEPEYNQIALIDSSTGEGQILVDQASYAVRGMAWNPDGSQFLFWRQPVSEWGYEGEIWIYDMERNETTPLNEVGSSVHWLN